MSVSQQVIDEYRQEILTNHVEAQRRLLALAKADNEQFMDVSHRLLEDTAIPVQRVVLSLLSQLGNKQDPFVEAKALLMIDIPELHEVALLALGRVATSAAHPLLFRLTQHGDWVALRTLRRLDLSPGEQQQAVELARQFLLAPNYALREAALAVLLRYSNAVIEEHHLLEAVRLYYDEVFIGELGQASKDIIPVVRQLQAQFPNNSAEYRDFAYALKQLQERFSDT